MRTLGSVVYIAGFGRVEHLRQWNGAGNLTPGPSPLRWRGVTRVMHFGISRTP